MGGEGFNEPAVFGINFREEDYYTGKLPRFYDPENYPQIKAIEAQWEIMRDEIMAFLESGAKLQGFTSPTSPGLSYPEAWKKIYFMNSLWVQFGNCKKLPRTWGIIRQIPGVTLGAVLILEPDGKILPHCSESNINIRCHLGIKIPAAHPACGIKVGSEEQGWQEGKVLMFSDCHLHTVWNNTNESRIIVAFDILHKVYDKERIWMNALYLSALTLRSLDTYVPFRRSLPALFTRALHKIVGALWYLYLPLQLKVEAMLWPDKV